MPMQTTHHPSWSVEIRRTEPAGAASHIFSQMPENYQPGTFDWHATTSRTDRRHGPSHLTTMAQGWAPQHPMDVVDLAELPQVGVYRIHESSGDALTYIRQSKALPDRLRTHMRRFGSGCG